MDNFSKATFFSAKEGTQDCSHAGRDLRPSPALLCWLVDILGSSMCLLSTSLLLSLQLTLVDICLVPIPSDRSFVKFITSLHRTRSEGQNNPDLNHSLRGSQRIPVFLKCPSVLSPWSFLNLLHQPLFPALPFRSFYLVLWVA